MPLQNSTDRILTTHTGSLPRTPELTALLVARDQGAAYDERALREETAAVLARTVDAQLDVGLDVVNDGEVPRVGFSTYIRERLSGFGGTGHRKPTLDSVKFPEYAAFQARQIDEGATFARVWDTPVAQGVLEYDPERAGIREDLDGFARELDRNAAAGRTPAGTFLSAATPASSRRRSCSTSRTRTTGTTASTSSRSPSSSASSTRRSPRAGTSCSSTRRTWRWSG